VEPLPWIQHEPIDADAFEALRRRMIFECFKWDPQVGDVSVLLPTPLVLTGHAWEELAGHAEVLYRECIAAEQELLHRPKLLRRLGLPRVLRLAMTCSRGPAREAARVMRFDFHFTDEGWRISEVNADVPGGFIEASAFSQSMSELTCQTRPAGDPSGTLADAIRDRLGRGARVAMVYATAYADDAQVMHYLSHRLDQAGLRSQHFGPDHPDIAHCDGIVRFFPAEWLLNLPRRCWRRYFARQMPPQCNPPLALLTQCKSFPLTWHELHAPLPAWRKLLPSTRAAPPPRRIDWDQWIIKPVVGRVGEAIGMKGVTPKEDLERLRRALRWGGRRDFVIQERFRAVPWPTVAGPMFPCIGVFVIDGVACGAYGRAAPRPLIDHRAHEVAVLVAEPPRARVGAPIDAGVASCA
jgi:glutathionylspermidine synthase